MPVIDLQNVSFAYTGGSGDGCLRGIDLDIEPGEVVLLCGPSGCGKTTLTRLINGLVPHYYDGALTGRVLVAGQNVAETPLYEMAKWVGSVFQNPRSQFFNVETTGEMAFCCENLGVPVAEIRRRMAAVVNSLDMQHLMGRSMFRLSGGEKQRVACAAVSVAEPAVVVLDEPSSNLDMAAIHGLRRQIARWKQQGKTVVVAEHRLHYLNGLADRVLYMRDGAVAIEFTPDKLSAMGAQELDALGLRPFSWDMLHGYKGINRAADSQSAEIRLNRFHFGYRRCPACLNVDGAAFPGNGIVALIGKNGAGKSTLARCLCGLEKRCKGELALQSASGRNDPLNNLNRRRRLKSTFLVMQDVNHQLFAENVLDEVLLSLPGEDKAEAERILAGLDLLEFKERHPMSLSGGQKQRVAIASAVASARPYILLDEPTSGLDLHHMKQVAEILKALQKAGKTLMVVTHDPEFILHCCTHVLRLEGGANVESYALDDAGQNRLLEFFTRPDGGALSGPEIRRKDCCGHAQEVERREVG